MEGTPLPGPLARASGRPFFRRAVEGFGEVVLRIAVEHVLQLRSAACAFHCRPPTADAMSLGLEGRRC
jgi:hypothetical protein